MSGHPDEPTEGRATYVVSQLYYYVAAVVGVGFVIGGLIASLFGVRTLVLPREFEQARDGLRGILLGLSFAIPGAVTVWWHLREARRREGRVLAETFWGRSLYFHLVALLALLFVLGGTVRVLGSAVEGLVPHCPSAGIAGIPHPPPPPPEETAASATLVRVEDDCYPQASEAARSALDAAIFIIGAGPVFWWHLRQGRRLSAAA